MTRRWVTPRWYPTAAVSGVFLATLLYVLPVWVRAFEQWAPNDDLRFGFLLLPTAGWLAVAGRRRRHKERASPPGSLRALLLVVAAAVLYALLERVTARSPAACAAGVLVFAEISYLWGWRTGRRLAFPVALVTFGLALQPTLVSPIGFWLQGITAGGAEVVSRIAGLSIVREGLVLRGSNFNFIVAEACSGMNSLLALVGLAAVWIYVTRGTLPGRIAIAASVMPVVIVSNTMRVVVVMLVANYFGQDAAIGFFHSASSLVLFGLALAGLFSVSHLVGCRTLAIA